MNIGRRSKKEDQIPTHACDYGQIQGNMEGPYVVQATLTKHDNGEEVRTCHLRQDLVLDEESKNYLTENCSCYVDPSLEKFICNQQSMECVLNHYHPKQQESNND